MPTTLLTLDLSELGDTLTSIRQMTFDIALGNPS